ncbi:hypothetical protein [Rothia dentocariosa]|jgi:hypothetical protein|uniref:hypothetical protein n=1 Tax=Rothia dentocariosa TaxID=2047 RepID=UPI00244D6BB5|nr:hypothetical protein [Rothia dentocariosa]
MEVKDIIISIAVPLVAAFMSYLGSRRGTKIAREELENKKKATPPMLLRLEKWSTILKDLEEYPKNLNIDIETIVNNYRDILSRATLENQILNLGILSEEVRRELVMISPRTGRKNYPRFSRGNYRYKGWYIIIMVMILSFLILIISQSFVPIVGKLIQGDSEGWIEAIGIVVALVLSCILFKDMNVAYNEVREKNIIFRNGYYALRNVYLARKSIELIESSKEKRERKGFEKSKIYKRWKNKIKNEHPEWESWNYGLDIGSDNNPEKANNSIEYYI